MGQPEKAITELEETLSQNLNVDFHLINILAELYMGLGELLGDS